MAWIGFGAPAWRGALGITLALAAAGMPAGAPEATGSVVDAILAVKSTTAAPREHAAPPAAPRRHQTDRREAGRPPAAPAAPRAEAAPEPAGDGQAVVTRAFFVCSFDCPTFLPAGDGPRQKAVARRT